MLGVDFVGQGSVVPPAGTRGYRFDNTVGMIVADAVLRRTPNATPAAVLPPSNAGDVQKPPGATITGAVRPTQGDGPSREERPIVVQVHLAKAKEPPPASPAVASKAPPAGAPKVTPVSKKLTLLHLLQYDIVYQLKSAADTLRRILVQSKLVGLPTPTTSVLLRALCKNVRRIIRGVNIVMQLVESVPRGGVAEKGEGREAVAVPPIPLPIPPKRSVAEFLQFEVLYQLQGVAQQAAMILEDRARHLDFPLATLPEQHQKVFTTTARETQKLSRNINVCVQAALDGALERQLRTATASSSSSNSSRLSSSSPKRPSLA